MAAASRHVMKSVMCRVDQGDLAGVQASKAPHRQVHGQEELGYGGRVPPRHEFRDGHRLSDRHHDQFGAPAAGQQCHHPIADQHAVHILTERRDLAGALEPDDVADAGWGRVVAGPLHQVRPVDRRGAGARPYTSV